MAEVVFAKHETVKAGGVECPVHKKKMRAVVNFGNRVVWVCGRGKKAHVLMSEVHDGKLEFYAPSWVLLVAEA